MFLVGIPTVGNSDKKFKPLRLIQILISNKTILVRLKNEIKGAILDVKNTKSASNKHYKGL